MSRCRCGLTTKPRSTGRRSESAAWSRSAATSSATASRCSPFGLALQLGATLRAARA